MIASALLRRVITTLAVSLLLAVDAWAQRRVWVVATQPGAGVDFTRVQDAHGAAAAGDVILVKDGVFRMGSFNFDKGVALVAEHNQQAILEGNMLIYSLPAGRALSFSGFVLRAPPVPGPGDIPIPLRMRGCLGTVSLQACTILPGGILLQDVIRYVGIGTLDIQQCAAVQLEDCVMPRATYNRGALRVAESQVAVIRGLYHAGDSVWAAGTAPSTGIQCYASTLLMADVEARGSDSTASTAPGGQGLAVAQNSTAWIEAPRPGTIVGGDAGFVGLPLSGGAGLWFRGPGRVYLDGSPFLGGRGSTNPVGPVGLPIDCDVPPVQRPQPMLVRTPTAFPRGGSTRLDLTAGPLEPHWILMSPSLRPANTPGLGGPFWLLESPSWFVLALFFTDTTGRRQLTLPIPNAPELAGAHAWIQDVGVLPGLDIVPSVPVGGVIW